MGKLIVIFPNRNIDRYELLADIYMKLDYDGENEPRLFPECGLHPESQLRLADELLAEGEDTVVVTYSDLILARLLRRIAEHPQLRERVSFYIYDVYSRWFYELKVDSNGQLKNAPEGFFEEGYKEALEHAKVIENKEDE